MIIDPASLLVIVVKHACPGFALPFDLDNLVFKDHQGLIKVANNLALS
jgi:hypothetical protein